MIRVMILCLLAALPARAETVVAGLSQSRVAITTSFAGSEILIFGAVKRETPILRENPLHVLISVVGPMEPVTIRRKDRRVGIWINTEAVALPAAPSFYAVASSGPLSAALTETEDLRHKVSIERAIRSIGASSQADNSTDFIEALIRLRTEEGLYQSLPSRVSFQEQTLFRTSIKLPANLTEGDYTARIFLTRGGTVIDRHEITIGVRKVGLERWAWTLAHERPFIYGLLSLSIAILAGWGASTLFRYIRS
ncbi:uncharacterized protein (TIGR02186 family) [Rhodovulum imhoffii]|uniref:Uncharacterized protein (TIGR02186 family) n=1 Tax=Rhodovulum imhoffii TaxID=365340 RepID=A0A2T5BP18_9RHOB|nr:TIGR02186 family protein [Rhodovulum imhoffii]MBK5933738.1 hypothetical protein [Rhodovulum imhoffii]PTN00760.1 uncharacterized protein (TIGR02186 family) [Rhodovulum imhoffii]